MKERTSHPVFQAQSVRMYEGEGDTNPSMKRKKEDSKSVVKISLY